MVGVVCGGKTLRHMFPLKCSGVNSCSVFTVTVF